MKTPGCLKVAGLIVVFCLGVFAANGQDSKPAPSPAANKTEVRERPTGSISGTVSDDGGHPIPNAVVMVGALTSFNAVSKSEATDENGRFSAKDLASGTYRIQVQSPAYIQSDDTLRGPDGSPRFYRTGEEVSFTLEKGGVITGTVTDQAGAALVGVSVTAIRIRPPNEQTFSSESMAGVSRATDDRGIYRIYGLRTGRYLVFASSGRGFSPRPGPYDRDAPTYYPSSNRDTASAVNVQTGQELSGIDIRYRGDRGYTISGLLSGVTDKVALVSLLLPGNATPVGMSFSQEQDGRNPFSISGVSNGEYKVVAFSNDDKAGRSASGTVSVSVKNGDVEGVVIKLVPFASISGRFVLTTPFEPKCNNAAIPGLEQAVVSARPEKDLPESLFASRLSDAAAEINGQFSIRSLSAGNYRMRTSLPTADWYIRSIERSTQNPQSPKTAAPPELVTLGNGENLSGLNINLANGAASVDGHITSAAQPPELISFRRLYLVPSEKERSDDTLRFSDTPMTGDGMFAFRNLAPGRYFLVSKTIKDPDSFRPLYWDAKERTSLVAEAAATGLAVDIKPCQSIRDLEFKLGPNGVIK